MHSVDAPMLPLRACKILSLSQFPFCLLSLGKELPMAQQSVAWTSFLCCSEWTNWVFDVAAHLRSLLIIGILMLLICARHPERRKKDMLSSPIPKRLTSPVLSRHSETKCVQVDSYMYHKFGNGINLTTTAMANQYRTETTGAMFLIPSFNLY